MVANTTISLDLSAVPDFRRIELADGAIQLARRLFSLPGVEEEYQRWLKKRGGERNDTEKE